LNPFALPVFEGGRPIFPGVLSGLTLLGSNNTFDPYCLQGPLVLLRRKSVSRPVFSTTEEALFAYPLFLWMDLFFFSSLNSSDANVTPPFLFIPYGPELVETSPPFSPSDLVVLETYTGIFTISGDDTPPPVDGDGV